MLHYAPQALVNLDVLERLNSDCWQEVFTSQLKSNLFNIRVFRVLRHHKVMDNSKQSIKDFRVESDMDTKHSEQNRQRLTQLLARPACSDSFRVVWQL